MTDLTGNTGAGGIHFASVHFGSGGMPQVHIQPQTGVFRSYQVQAFQQPVMQHWPAQADTLLNTGLFDRAVSVHTHNQPFLPYQQPGAYPKQQFVSFPPSTPQVPAYYQWQQPAPVTSPPFSRANYQLPGTSVYGQYHSGTIFQPVSSNYQRYPQPTWPRQKVQAHIQQRYQSLPQQPPVQSAPTEKVQVKATVAPKPAPVTAKPPSPSTGQSTERQPDGQKLATSGPIQTPEVITKAQEQLDDGQNADTPEEEHIYETIEETGVTVPSTPPANTRITGSKPAAAPGTEPGQKPVKKSLLSRAVALFKGHKGASRRNIPAAPDHALYQTPKTKNIYSLPVTTQAAVPTRTNRVPDNSPEYTQVKPKALRSEAPLYENLSTLRPQASKDGVYDNWKITNTPKQQAGPIAPPENSNQRAAGEESVYETIAPQEPPTPRSSKPSSKPLTKKQRQAQQEAVDKQKKASLENINTFLKASKIYSQRVGEMVKLLKQMKKAYASNKNDLGRELLLKTGQAHADLNRDSAIFLAARVTAEEQLKTLPSGSLTDKQLKNFKQTLQRSRKLEDAANRFLQQYSNRTIDAYDLPRLTRYADRLTGAYEWYK